MRLVLAMSGVLLAAGVSRADTLITFDDLPIDTPVNTQYLSLAVNGQTFSGGAFFNGTFGFPGFGPHISNVATPHSGSNLLIENPAALEFAEGPLTFQFTLPQQTVQLYGGFVATPGAPTRQATLNGYAFDSSGNQIPTPVAVDGPKTITGGSAATLFSISSATPNISKVVFDAGIAYAVIDDLQFGGGGSGQGLPAPPVVVLDNPAPALDDYVHSPLLVSGTVSGVGLLPTVTGVITPLDHPPFPYIFQSTGVMPIVATLPETFSNTFPGTIGVRNTTLPIGNYQVIVTATNSIGQSGAAGVQFLNFPPLLFQDPPDVAAGHGGFQFAQPTGACQVVVYEHGASAYFQGVNGAPDFRILMPPTITNKWLAVQNDPDEVQRLRLARIIGGDATLGCPKGDVITIPAGVHTAQVQDFERGRIYTIDAIGLAAYTPTVFVNAITAMSIIVDPASPLGSTLNDQTLGAREVGIPIKDPDLDWFVDDPTWLFQQFTRFGINTGANTLEIRGKLPNPKLYIERIGGSANDFKAATGADPDSRAATIWESYDCSNDAQTGQLQCPVTRFHLQTVTPGGVQMYTNAATVADYQQYCPLTDVSIINDCTTDIVAEDPEWCAGPKKPGELNQEPSSADFADIQAMGWVKVSEHAGVDWPSSHEHMHYNKTGAVASFLGSVARACEYLVLGCQAGGYLVNVISGDLVAGSNGWADWGLQVRPLALAMPDPNSALLNLPMTAVSPIPPFWTLMAANGDPSAEAGHCSANTGNIEVEWEADWWPYNDFAGLHIGDPPTDNSWNPEIGDLVMLNGRWIMDCAHFQFHSEIHPPNTIIRVDSAVPAGSDPSTPNMTRAQIWINEFYEGGGLNINMWPPPRPSATARLSSIVTSYYNVTMNPDGSVGASFVNAPVAPFGFPAPEASRATMSLGADGVRLAVSGPPSSHEVKETGQAILPNDDSTHATGAAGDFVGLVYIGWNQ